MNNLPINRQDYSPLGFANLENVAINNHQNLQSPLDNNLNFNNQKSQQQQPSTINSTLSPLLNQLSLNKANDQQISPRSHHNSSMNPNQAYIRIVEQPARCALRFRYECEGRSAGSIPGCNSTSDNKSYPTIEIVNYSGPAVVVVSCVTKESPYRPHPHNLVGKEGCKKGVCTLMISNNQMRCTFTSLGIQCVKKKDIEESLKLREQIKVDPFRTGFSHRSHATIDLNVVRLCFQVFIEGNEKEKFNVPLQPIVSDPIYDKKAMSDLNIIRLSHCSAPVSGGQEIILLCDRITKDDIQIKFYEEQNGQLIWETLAEFQPNDVHKQVAICFRVPKYYQEFINQPLTVYIQLRRPSDGHLSEPRPFQYVPNNLDQCSPIVRKRQKFDDNLSSSVNENSKKRNYDTQLNEFCVPRLSMNTMQIETTDQQSQLNTLSLQPPQSFFMQETNSPIQQLHSPSDNFNENTNYLTTDNSMMHNFVKNENEFTLPSTTQFNQRNRFTFGQIKEEQQPNIKTESLELDIDANDLLNDINFNNMMINISGNNITFNSSGNIKMESNNNSNNNGQNDQLQPNTLLDISNLQQNNHHY